MVNVYKAIVLLYNTDMCVERGLRINVMGFFSERYNLLKHQRLGKCAEPAQIHQCTRCGRGFQARRFMLQHTEMCGVEQKFNCKICGKVFPLKSNLTRHELSCGRPKEFVCNLCGEACSGQQELVYHKRIFPSKQTVAT